MKEKKALIKIVKDNKEKQTQYNSVKDRYKAAMEQGFYGEALLINYAIIEDRLKSFLYYSGGMLKKNDLTVSVDNPVFIKIFGLNEDKDKYGNPTGKIAVRNVSRKIRILKTVLKCTKKYEGENRYYLLLKQGLGSNQDIDEFLVKLNKLERQWSKERNEITHGLLNKNTEDLQKKYVDICERGKEYADYFDNIVKRFKRRVNIRQYLELEK